MREVSKRYMATPPELALKTQLLYHPLEETALTMPKLKVVELRRKRQLTTPMSWQSPRAPPSNPAMLSMKRHSVKRESSAELAAPPLCRAALPRKVQVRKTPEP